MLLIFLYSDEDCGGLPNPINGFASTPTGTSERSLATYSCDLGYVLIGATIRVCGGDGIWVPSAPTCDRKKNQ